MLRDQERQVGKLSWVLVALGFAAAIVLNACGGGDSGGNGNGAATLQATFGPASFKTGDLKDSGTLTLTPISAFTGKATVTIQTNITEPNGFSKIPSTVTITVPGSPVTVSGAAAVNTSVNFAWTAWPVGNYGATATVTS